LPCFLLFPPRAHFHELADRSPLDRQLVLLGEEFGNPGESHRRALLSQTEDFFLVRNQDRLVGLSGHEVISFQVHPEWRSSNVFPLCPRFVSTPTMTSNEKRKQSGNRFEVCFHSFLIRSSA